MMGVVSFIFIAMVLAVWLAKEFGYSTKVRGNIIWMAVICAAIVYVIKLAMAIGAS